MGMRRSRYVELQKTPLQHVITAAAMNLMRAVAWQLGIPHAATRQSPFAVLMASAAWMSAEHEFASGIKTA
jgi:transposase